MKNPEKPAGEGAGGVYQRGTKAPGHRVELNPRFGLLPQASAKGKCKSIKCTS